MNKNYNSGRRFEYRVKKYLEKRGYYVMRSAGSKSPFDLIAIPHVEISLTGFESILLIQCKHNIKITKKERENLNDFAVLLTNNVQCIIAWSKSHGKIIFEDDYFNRVFV